MTHLETRWSISRGRETYGYNICSLWADGRKVSSCKGGGYDMVGTALGNYVEEAYQDRLLAIADRAAAVWCETETGPYGCERNDKGLYGLSVTRYLDGRTVARIDGACGRSSVEQVIEAIGLRLTYLPSRGNNYHWTLEEAQA